MARTWYQLEIRNDELGEVKVVRGSTPAEAEAKAAKQLARWQQQAQKLRERRAIQDLQALADAQTEEARALIAEYRTILHSTLVVNDRLDWNDLMDHKEFVAPSLDRVPPKAPPTLDAVRVGLNVPEPSWIEKILPAKRQQRLELETLAQQKYEQHQLEYEKQVKDFEEYSWNFKIQVAERRREFDERRNRFNSEVAAFRDAYERGEPESIENYATLVLERSSYPDGFENDFELEFEVESRTLIVDYKLPNPDGVPRITEYRFVRTRKEIDPKEMSQREFREFYDGVIFQTTLRTIHEIFESDYSEHIGAVVFNGWVDGIDPATGQDFTSCIISCHASREVFQTIELSRVDPKEAVRGLKALTAGSLSQLAPVRPIMELSREDRRFVDAKEILGELDSTQNLAEMPWEDFEHLVRELFSEVFSREGGEVHVTQASRDGGVDAIAFDPTPIRGGKFVIQAKRYNGVVPVAAVRDLYGTMINEGATKGILVTTGYYGPESHEFAKDKPLELIDGSNLVYMFQEHGHNVRIELRKRSS